MKSSLDKHYEWRGKIETSLRVPLETKEDLAIAYTPGVAEACLAIKEDETLSFELTRRWNTVAVVTNGTAVLGLGDIGPVAAMPVMEGKAALFKQFANIDAVPICIATNHVDEFVDVLALLEGSFGGINLEDIASPKCFEIERRLKERLNIPVFHDDQHGTAIVTLAAVNNAIRLTGKNKDTARIIINGIGAAGTAIAHLLVLAGYKDIIACDKDGVICRGTSMPKSVHQKELAQITNLCELKGSLANALVDADVFIGVSVANCLTYDMVKSMNKKSCVLAMANPVPEIMPDIALAAGAYIVGTGRSDFKNQINNSLAFPGVFRGALDARTCAITDDMKIAAACAIAKSVSDSELSPDYIIPDALDKDVPYLVAEAIKSSVK